MMSWLSYLFNPKTVTKENPVEYRIGGGWSDAIQWTTDWDVTDITSNGKYRVHGWKQDKPEAGDYLIGEFEKSIITFIFTYVEDVFTVQDMFHADVKIIKQVMKDGSGVWES